MSQHDASYKLLFANPLMVRSLFDGILQAASPDLALPGANDLDWSMKVSCCAKAGCRKKGW